VNLFFLFFFFCCPTFPDSSNPYEGLLSWTDVAFCFMPGVRAPIKIDAGCSGTPLYVHLHFKTHPLFRMLLGLTKKNFELDFEYDNVSLKWWLSAKSFVNIPGVNFVPYGNEVGPCE
jgi:hypothetical protein